MLKNLMELQVVLVVLILCGCANPYAKYYRDLTNGTDFINNPNFEITNGPPRLIITDNPAESALKLREDGYLPLGFSSFWARDLSESKAIKHGEQIKASIVLFFKKYRNTESGSIPLTLPSTQTSNSSYSGNIYGTGGNASFYGSGTTTTYGTQTTYIPYEHDYYDYAVSYWIKQKNFRLGAVVIDLSNDDKMAIGSNKGVKVDVVVKNTPAYNADILRGDLIKKIEDDPVLDITSFQKHIVKNEGKIVKITLIRNGQEITKKVNIDKVMK